MARTFQNLRIFVNMSMLDNVLVGCHRHERSGFWAGGLGFPSQGREEKRSRARAIDALELVGLKEQANLPASSLPYGQQRLVEIARALASEPELLLLDEPAAGMNSSEREYLIERIGMIRDAGVTVLLVEHDMGLVMDISDEVNCLDYGKLIACGTPEKIQGDEKVIAAYLGVDRGEVDLCATRDLVDGESCPVPEDMLVVEDLVTSYGSIEALHGISLTVHEGMVVAVLGANGGKSTLLHAISGIVHQNRGQIHFQGTDITHMAPEKIVTRGICQVSEGRQLFPSLSVEDNLVVGATGRRDRSGLSDDIAYVYDHFPILRERRRQDAGTLSGGEQQMLAIGRALTGHPALLLLDEPSMGLAPLAVERIFEALAKLNQEGLTMLMVEQNAEMALSLAHRAVVLQTGNGPCRARLRYLGRMTAYVPAILAAGIVDGGRGRFGKKDSTGAKEQVMFAPAGNDPANVAGNYAIGPAIVNPAAIPDSYPGKADLVAFVQRWQADNPKEPFASLFLGYAYDAIHIAKMAIEGAATQDAAGYAAAMLKVDFWGANGHTVYSATDHIGSHSGFMQWQYTNSQRFKFVRDLNAQATLDPSTISAVYGK